MTDPNDALVADVMEVVRLFPSLPRIEQAIEDALATARRDERASMPCYFNDYDRCSDNHNVHVICPPCIARIEAEERKPR